MAGVVTTGYNYFYGDNNPQKFKNLIEDLKNKLNSSTVSESERAEIKERIANIKMQSKNAMKHDRALNFAIETVKFASGNVLGPLGSAASNYAMHTLKKEVTHRLNDNTKIQKARIAGGVRVKAPKSPKNKRENQRKETILQQRAGAVSQAGISVLKGYAMKMVMGGLIGSLAYLSAYWYNNPH